MAAILPLAAIGAFAMYGNRTTSPQAKVATEDEELRVTHRAIIREYGMSAAVEQSMNDRKYLQGGIINDGVGVDNTFSQNLDNPNFDPLEYLQHEMVALAAFDRADTQLAQTVQQAKIVPRRNNQMAVALSEEVFHPDDPTSQSSIYVSKFSPAHANARQVLEGDMELGRHWESDHERSLRAWNGSQFFDHAAGQSFRYSED